MRPTHWLCARRALAAVACALAGSLTCVGGAQAATSTPYFTALPASGGTQLQVARAWAVAAPLPDGRVLIAGGFGKNYLQSAELFNPVGDTFTALPASGSTELQTAREYAVAAPLPGGQVLIAGGFNGGGQLQSAELYDPASGAFSALPATGSTQLQTARYGALAAPLPDGQVLIAGGYNEPLGYLQSAELFNPADDTFTPLPASGSTQLQAVRADAASVPLRDGRILIAGGSSGGALQSAELFDPASTTFTSLPASGSTELQTGRAYAAAATLANGQVLIAGGFNGSYLQTAELFDPATETFSALPASGNTQLQIPRDGPISAPLPTGQILIAGGVDFGEAVSSAELFLPAAQATSEGGSFGSEVVGTPTPTSALVVTNVGAQGLAITGTSLAGANPGDFGITADGCSGRTLGFQQSCTITARFTPTAAGAREATIALSDNEQSPAAVPLSGTGIALPGSNPLLGSLPGTLVRPVVSGLRESAKTWREGNAFARISSGTRRKQLPVGTTFTFNLNERASLTFTFTQQVAGRTLGKKCVPKSSRNRTRPRCTRTVTAGTLTFAGHAGTNTVRFAGPISARKRLSPGSYTLNATATASGLRSAASTLRFTIVRH